MKIFILDFSRFIARKLLSNNEITTNNSNELLGTKPIVKIAIGAIALGFIVLLLSIAILNGFKREVQDKVTSFGGHLQLTSFTPSNAIQQIPIEKNNVPWQALNDVNIKNYCSFATIPGIIKTDIDIEGVILKGFDSHYDWQAFKDKLIEGKLPTIKENEKTDDVIISEQTANRLNLKLNDKLFMYFVQQPPRMRKFTICGIYKTGLEDFDKAYVFGDLAHVQKLHNWGSNKIAGVEIRLQNYSDINTYKKILEDAISFDLSIKTVEENFPQLFGWLELQDINVQIILILITIICSINVVSALLIMILERTNTIGILKALGANDRAIRRIFILNAFQLILKGLAIGNIIGISFCLLQYYFKFIPLDEVSYYVAYVPIKFDILTVLLLNAGTIFLCLAIMLIPTYVVSKITPIKAIRFN